MLVATVCQLGGFRLQGSHTAFSSFLILTFDVDVDDDDRDHHDNGDHECEDYDDNDENERIDPSRSNTMPSQFFCMKIFIKVAQIMMMTLAMMMMTNRE